MQLKFKGKTKDVYQAADGTMVLKFKDDVTGTDGVFDPGANTVGLTMEGAGKSGLKLSTFFFERINAAGIPTHFISADIENTTMNVKAAQPFGKGVEVILRYRAVGSFLRRYGLYCTEGDKLPALVEVTLKDDARNDPLINEEALEMLGIMSRAEYQILAQMTKDIGAIIHRELAAKGLELYDIKFEFGRVDADQHIALIDEISGGNMRAYQNGKSVEPLKLEQIMLA